MEGSALPTLELKKVESMQVDFNICGYENREDSDSSSIISVIKEETAPHIGSENELDPLASIGLGAMGKLIRKVAQENSRSGSNNNLSANIKSNMFSQKTTVTKVMKESSSQVNFPCINSISGSKRPGHSDITKSKDLRKYSNQLTFCQKEKFEEKNR
jgi:hypothetical protein